MSGAFLGWDGGRLEGSGWQGIHHLSIAFDEGDGFAASVTVHLAQPGDLGEDHVQVLGGRRITDLRYEVVPSAGTRELRLRFRELGDHSVYRVCLSDGGDPNLRIHPFFSLAELRFGIDCESGDCREGDQEASVAVLQRPAVDMLTKDYNGFVRVLTDWIKVRNPHWADLSAASLERTLVELLAWHGDMLSYYQDRVANEAFIDTATQRYSVRQHAVLLGARLFDGQAATTVIGIDVGTATEPRAGWLPAGLEVRTRGGDDEAPVVFHIPAPAMVDSARNSEALTIAAWPAADRAYVPSGATELLLWGHGTTLQAGRRLAFVWGAWSQVVTLISVDEVNAAGWVGHPDDAFDRLVDPPSPVTRITFSEPLERTLRPWSEHVDLRIYGNLVDAVHGQRRTTWLHPVTSGSPTRNDVLLRLQRRNSIVGHQLRGGERRLQLRALQVPEAPVIHEGVGQDSTVPALEVEIGGEIWTRVEHLLASRAYDTHYTADADEDGSVWIRFGDGLHGRELDVTRNEERGLDEPAISVVLRYRIGDPISGNVALGAIRELIQPRTGTDEEAALSALTPIRVINVLPGTGGRQPESIDKARELVPASLRHGELQRAVSLQDYAAVAEQVPGVARATARALGGPFDTVLVLVDPEGATELSEALRQRVWARVDTLRMAGREHFVVAPEYVPLEVELLLCAEPGIRPHRLRSRVLTQLRPGSDERPGWFHPDRLSFGDRPAAGDLIAAVQAIPGVRQVTLIRFRKRGDPSETLVYSTLDLGPTQVARLDANPDFPEGGILTVRVAGLDAHEVDGVGNSVLVIDRPGPSTPEHHP